jgi:hypothetical protein
MALGEFRHQINTAVTLQAADGSTFTEVIDAAPEDVLAERELAGPGGLMLVRDRRSDEPGQLAGFHWQIFVSSLVSIDATDGPPRPLPVLVLPAA